MFFKRYNLKKFEILEKIINSKLLRIPVKYATAKLNKIQIREVPLV